VPAHLFPRMKRSLACHESLSGKHAMTPKESIKTRRPHDNPVLGRKPDLQAGLESSSDGVEFGRGYVLMLDYNELVLKKQLQSSIEGACASSWSELEQYVSRFFDWI
jgi:hypothetical protein